MAQVLACVKCIVMIMTMHETNLAGVDLNLLPCLEALLRRRNVTQAAADVGLSQPAMSRALSRLRALLQDPLLVRGRNGFVLTPKASRLAGPLGGALGDLRSLFTDRAFDPAAAQRTVRIAASDTQTILLTPVVTRRLALEAPGIDLRMEPYGPDLADRMEAGTLDLAFALATTPLPPGAMSEPIAADRLALVMRQDHPAAMRPWSIEDYGRFHHVGVSLLGDGRSELDAILAAAGVTRRIALTTPHFMAALAAVAATDLVTTISRTFARRFAEGFGLVLKDPPFAQIDLTTTIVWSRVRAGDPLLGWMRGVLRQAAQSLEAAPSGVAG